MTTVQEAESEARQLLRSAWWDDASEHSPLPVDPMRLAERLGIKVDTDLLPMDESGKITMTPGGPVVISLNFWDHHNRQRFTCAHEIGHYLRRDQTGIRSYVDYRDTLAGLGTDREEIYANQFAAALLMPAHLVQRWHLIENVEELAKRFGTSRQAMELRLRNLRLA